MQITMKRLTDVRCWGCWQLDMVSSAGSHALCDCACKFLCSRRIWEYSSSGLTGYLNTLFHHLLCQTTLTLTFQWIPLQVQAQGRLAHLRLDLASASILWATWTLVQELCKQRKLTRPSKSDPRSQRSLVIGTWERERYQRRQRRQRWTTFIIFNHFKV